MQNRAIYYDSNDCYNIPTIMDLQEYFFVFILHRFVYNSYSIIGVKQKYTQAGLLIIHLCYFPVMIPSNL